MTADLGAGDAVRLALAAQGLLGSPARPRAAGAGAGTGAGAGAGTGADAAAGVLRRLGALQLDTIAVLARSHELVCYARLGAVGRAAVEEACWGAGRALAADGPPTAFEYWSHAACVLPVESWPLFAFRRRHLRRSGRGWHRVDGAAVAEVRRRLAADGPATTRELGGARRGGPWWDWSAAKVAVEHLLDTGEVVCTRRVGWRRVYDLAERALPAHLLDADGWVDDEGVRGPADDECLAALVAAAGAALGVGTAADVADVHRLRAGQVRPHLAGALVPVTVDGWSEPAWAHPDALASLGAPAGRCRTTLLSPFDSLVWDRRRTQRLFGLRHRLEAYVPAERREHGYYAMPVLHRGRLVARVDPAREAGVLVARRVTFGPGRGGRVPADAVAGTARALRRAASWVACAGVRVDAVVPPAAGPPLAAALAQDAAAQPPG